MKLIKALLVMAVGWISWAAYAQYNGQYSPAIMNEISKAGAAASERNNAANAAAQAEANRQWWAEENRIRAKIEKLKQTPFYGAIAVDVGTDHTMWGGGYISKEIAIQRTLERCKTNNCQIVATWFNGCAMTALPDNDAKRISLQKINLGFDENNDQAILKAVKLCESRFGVGNCSYAGDGKNAVCSGYRYGIYNQK